MGATKERDDEKTFEEYFREEFASNPLKLEYRLVARVLEGGGVEFYIHPLSHDGNTWDFIVHENVIKDKNNRF